MLRVTALLLDPLVRLILRTKNLDISRMRGSQQQWNLNTLRPFFFFSLVTDSPSPRSPRSSDGTKDELSILALPCSSGSTRTNAAVRRLRMENEKLQAEVTRLRRLVVSGALSLLNEKKAAAAADGNVESPVKMQALQIELQLTKEALLSESIFICYRNFVEEWNFRGINSERIFLIR